MSDVNRVMFDAAVIRANESGEYATNEERAIQYAAGEIESLTDQLAECRAENERLKDALGVCGEYLEGPCDVKDGCTACAAWESVQAALGNL